MEKAQVREWAVAQKIALSIDLVEAAKKHLEFLATVESSRFLFEDDILARAVYRYNAFWLPLLAKHLENPVSEDPLVVPLDCELIWHCHRLNPIRYKFDCEKLHGRILGNHKVISSVQATSKITTEEIWNKLYPEEPYELDLQKPFSGDVLQTSPLNEKFTKYDLVAAVKRQRSFTYQALRPHMSDDLFLREAVARYKGFLHLIRTNSKMNLKWSCVPTYDVDLIWHTHQLYPDYYCKDVKALSGYVINHNDSDSDTTKGSKLDNGFTETTKQWAQSFGLNYWKAGAMYKGNTPSPVTLVPYEFNVMGKEFSTFEKCGLQIESPTLKAVEVLLEIVDIKNLPEVNKENLLIGVSKIELDRLFHSKRWLGISAASKEKMFAVFQCEPKGEFHFELMSNSPTSDEVKPKKALKLLGSFSLSFEELFTSRSQLSVNEWVSVDLEPGVGNSEPVLLHVSMSYTPPMPAPDVFLLVRSQTSKNDQIEANVIHFSGRKVFSLQKRSTVKDVTKCTSDLLTEVYCVTDSGEKHALVEFDGNFWSLKGNNGSFKVQNNSGDDNSLIELVGYNKMMKLFPGRRLELEPKPYENKNNEPDFITVVEFSADYPYGRGVALINSKSGTVKAVDESVVLPGIALAFILSNISAEESRSDFKIETEVMAKNGSQCIGQCTKCDEREGDSLDMVKGAQSNIFPSAVQGGSQCIGQCTKCDETEGDSLDMVKGAQSDIFPGSVQGGSQCIGQCTKCDEREGDSLDMVKGAQSNIFPGWVQGGSQCIGQCTKCDERGGDSLDMVKAARCSTICFDTKECPIFPGLVQNDGSQCIGQCTKCDEREGGSSDMVKAAQCSQICYAPPLRVLEQEYAIFPGLVQNDGSQCIGQCTKCDEREGDSLDMVKAAIFETEEYASVPCF